MRLSILTKILVFFVSLSASAQTRFAPTNPEECGQYRQQEKIYEMNPGLRSQDSIDQVIFQQDYENYLTTYDPSERSTYTIPVVVHVVHLNGEENISNEQIYDAIEKLNADFSMANVDVGNTHPAFAGIVGNGDIDFKLSTIDPDGNCHSGITRTYSNTTFDTGMSGGGHPIVDAVSAQHGIWPQEKYMSVFVCIDPSGAAGYTYNPGNWFNSSQMYGAIFMRHDYMGVIGTSSSSRRHVLAHEAGHWLNLSHVWGSTNNSGLATNCNSDDGVMDTPNTRGSQGCFQGASSCGSVDNVQNIMDYNSSCRTMFTQGQVARMHTAINSGTAGRNNLITSANLAATGVSLPAPLCEAEFVADETVVCQGAAISFSDLSFHGITSRSWTFSGGNPSTSSDSVATVTYDTPGTYEVTISVTDGSTSITESKTDYVVVLPSSGLDAPIQESFEASPFPDNSFFSSTFNSVKDWEISTLSASSGNRSAFYDNFSKGSEASVSMFESGSIDLSGLATGENLLFSFDYAYRKREPNDDEWLRLYVSKDCGETWVLRKTIHGSILSSITESSPYQAISEDFKTVDVTNISSVYHVSNFRYRFTFTSDGGNNIFIDDINIYGENSLSINDSKAENKVLLFPNPVLNTLQAQVENPDLEAYKITNASGQLISHVTQPAIDGKRILTIDTEQLSSGIYYISLINQNTTTTKKFIKQ